MSLTTRIDGFVVTQPDINSMWEASCSHSVETFVFLDLPNALFTLAQYDFCEHPSHANFYHRDTPRIAGFPADMKLSDFIPVEEYFANNPTYGV